MHTCLSVSGIYTRSGLSRSVTSKDSSEVQTPYLSLPVCVGYPEGKKKKTFIEDPAADGIQGLHLLTASASGIQRASERRF